MTLWFQPRSFCGARSNIGKEAKDAALESGFHPAKVRFQWRFSVALQMVWVAPNHQQPAEKQQDKESNPPEFKKVQHNGSEMSTNTIYLVVSTQKKTLGHKLHHLPGEKIFETVWNHLAIHMRQGTLVCWWLQPPQSDKHPMVPCNSGKPVDSMKVENGFPQ